MDPPFDLKLFAAKVETATGSNVRNYPHKTDPQ